MAVTIPDAAVDNGNNVLPPLQELLQGINILGPTSDPVTGAQVLEADATALTKIATTVVAAAGGITAIATPIVSFIHSSSDSVRIAALAGASLALAAAILAIAYIVGIDLRSRTSGSIVIYEARKAITLQFLQEAVAASQDAQQQAAAGQGNKSAAAVVTALAAAAAKAKVQTTGQDQNTGHLTGVRHTGNVLEVQWTDAQNIDHWCEPDDLNIQSYTY